MAKKVPRDCWSWKVRLGVGCTLGAFLIIGLVHVELGTFFGNVAVSLFNANSENALRVLQSVGILLPLFVGLLRFTTSTQSEVSERLNDQLLLGILSLVFAGTSAVVAGMFTNMPGVLKLSLLFVLITFVVIGLAAGAMFGEFTAETGGNTDSIESDDTSLEAKRGRLKDDERSETGEEAESASNEGDVQIDDTSEK